MNNLPQRHREGRVSIKGLFCALCAFAVFPFVADAEIYKWTDDEGVIHVTDDPTKIPDKYWNEDRVKKEEVKPSPAVPQPVKPPEAPKGDKAELYGEHPLDWWIARFKWLRKNIADNAELLDREKNYVTVYEGGRGLGKIFTREEIAQYENYKADIPAIEEKLKKFNEELEELQRKATIHGVPKKIRE